MNDSNQKPIGSRCVSRSPVRSRSKGADTPVDNVQSVPNCLDQVTRLFMARSRRAAVGQADRVSRHRGRVARRQSTLERPQRLLPRRRAARVLAPGSPHRHDARSTLNTLHARASAGSRDGGCTTTAARPGGCLLLRTKSTKYPAKLAKRRCPTKINRSGRSVTLPARPLSFLTRRRRGPR
jgi:hypothetical protein